MSGWNGKAKRLQIFPGSSLFPPCSPHPKRAFSVELTVDDHLFRGLGILGEALKAFGLKPHLDDGGAEIMWSERRIDGARWYYIGAPAGESFKGTIRLEGKGKAEWWDPVSGTVKSLKAKGWGRMKKVFLDLAKAESGFIVFRKTESKFILYI